MDSFTNKVNKQSVSQKKDVYQTKGQQIMALSEAILPVLMQWLSGRKNKEGMPLQSSQIRGMALNIANDLYKHKAA